MAVLLTLAIGIGPNTLVFTLIDSYFLRPLPGCDISRVVFVSERTKTSSDVPVAYENYLDWRQQNDVFDSMAIFRSEDLLVQTAQGTERIPGMYVSAGFFGTLGARMSKGRAFLEEEDRPGARPVAIISHEMWNELFGSAEDLTGKAVRIGRESFSVVGVLPPRFRVGTVSSIFLPHCSQECTVGRGTHVSNYVISRLRPGASIRQAQSEMSLIASRLSREYPATNQDSGVDVQYLRDKLVGSVKPVTLPLSAAVVFVLLISCVNVANVRLSTLTGRERETAMRLALGASRAQIVRQFLVESMVLSGGGGIIGLGLSVAGSLILGSSIDPARLPAGIVSIDYRIFLFAMFISAVTGVGVSIGLASQLSKPNLVEALKEGGRTTTLTKGRQRFQQMLIAVEVALALILLISAGLMLQTLRHLILASPGFDPTNIMTMQLVPPRGVFRTGLERRTFVQHMLDEVRALPGVESAAVATPMPYEPDSNSMSEFAVAAQGMPASTQLPFVNVHYISPDYFHVMRIRLIRGRYLDETDNEDSGVAIINATLEKQYWPSQDALGAYFQLGSGGGAMQPKRVIGVVPDIKERSLAEPPTGDVYVPYYGSYGILVRSGAEPEQIAPVIRKCIQALGGNLAIYDIETMQERMSNSFGETRFAASLLSAFAMIAMVLSAVGIYGVVAYTSSKRTREIGIRMAFGGRAADIRALLFRKGMMAVVSGAAIGMVFALVATHMFGTLLFGVKSFDLFTFGVALLSVLLFGAVASYIPVRRATQLNLNVALRVE
jgi:putative ABC transport system permease protein